MGLTRRELISGLGAFGLIYTLSGCANISKEELKSIQNLMQKEFNANKIYNELPKHIHIAETIADTNEYGERKTKGCGVIVDQHYITMQHIVNAGSKLQRQTPWGLMEEPLTVKSQKTYIQGKELEEIFIGSNKDDVAVYKLPKDLNLPDFPAKPSSTINLGDKIYIIGNPGLSGSNVREDYISDIDGTAGENMKELAENTTDCFGIGKIVIPGDSGTPIVNSKFELLGLCKYQFAGGLGYVQKIDCYLKHINSKK
ncbi:MAG TPA: serine protease [Candidatus Nanoarchaeia archaeon]|nr:serine protease [Candidatus Nanoarchaeia archaeon]